MRVRRASCSGRPPSRIRPWPAAWSRLTAPTGSPSPSTSATALAIGHGWEPGTHGPPVEVALTRLADVGATTFEVTAIDRDGTLDGPDLGLLARLVAQGMGAIIASAGIATLADLRVVRGLGCAGAIVGRALYEGRLSLPDAIAEAAGPG